MLSPRAIYSILFFALLSLSVHARPVRRCPAVKSASSAPSITTPALHIVKGTTLSATSTASSTVQTPSVPKTSSSTSKSATTTTSTVKTVSPTSKAAPAPTSPVKTSLDKLFPVPGFSKSWTTFPSSNALALTDSTFRPTNVLTSVRHSYVNAPDGKRAMKAHYPKGSYTFGHNPQGGFSFYAPGPSSVDLTTAKEATFGYSVYFPAGFNFQLGGKLPGIYGGNSAAEAIGCSGGRRSSACFSARLMWRTNGQGEFYTYLPPYTDPRFAANKAVCNVAPSSDCNPTYGASVGRGSFSFATGAWTTVTERVRLNDVGQANGQIELFVNGKSVINVGGLILRDSAAGRMRGMQMQTFFGGSSVPFASPKDQDVYFSDFSVAITKTL